MKVFPYILFLIGKNNSACTLILVLYFVVDIYFMCCN